MDILFSDVILVPPSKFRPMAYFKGTVMEHPQTINFQRLLEANEKVVAIKMIISGARPANELVNLFLFIVLLNINQVF